MCVKTEKSFCSDCPVFIKQSFCKFCVCLCTHYNKMRNFCSRWLKNRNFADISLCNCGAVWMAAEIFNKKRCKASEITAKRSKFTFTFFFPRARLQSLRCWFWPPGLLFDTINVKHICIKKKAILDTEDGGCSLEWIFVVSSWTKKVF